MAFYTGDALPGWKGNLFLGALASKALIRLELDGDRVVHEERLLGGPQPAHPRRKARDRKARCMYWSDAPAPDGKLLKHRARAGPEAEPAPAPAAGLRSVR